MEKIKKISGPTPKERAEFLVWLQENHLVKHSTKRAAYRLLARSCGSTEGTVSKWFFPEESNSYRDCPYAVWRCWMIDTGYSTV